MIIQAINFDSRADLEAYVRNEIGTDISANRLAGHQIQGTAENLREFGLGASSGVYGVKVAVINNNQ